MREPEQSLRQSKELEALLFKLNGASQESESIHRNSNKLSDNLLYDESYSALDEDEDDLEEARDNSMDHSLTDESLDDMSRTYSDEEYNSFFEMDEAEGEEGRDVSSSIPVGSGSFARVPSGGFHLVFDSIKSACKGAVARVKALTSRKTSDRKGNDNSETEDKKRFVKLAVLGAVLAAIVALIVIVASGDDNKGDTVAEVAAQAPVAGNENFDVMALDDPDESFDSLEDLELGEDFVIPGDDEEGDVVAKPSEADKAAAEKAKKAAAAVAQKGNLKELRLYDQNDNVLAAPTQGKTFKTKSMCIMRQGPASRYGLAKNIPAKSTIQILADVDEDWVMQNGGVWTKAGHHDKLGPGDQFADAAKGMKLPQPKGRVISAKNWKYVQFGKTYGYVGPACFK